MYVDRSSIIQVQESESCQYRGYTLIKRVALSRGLLPSEGAFAKPPRSLRLLHPNELRSPSARNAPKQERLLRNALVLGLDQVRFSRRPIFQDGLSAAGYDESIWDRVLVAFP